MLSPFECLCRDFILPEPASYVFFYPLFNLRKLLYIICGDYYLPDLKLPEEKSYDLGRFGRAKLRHLRKCRRALLTSLRTSGTLNEYLHSVDEECEAMFFRLVRQYAEREGVTEQLKAEDMMQWVGRMNNIRSRAEEVVMREYVYEEDKNQGK